MKYTQHPSGGVVRDDGALIPNDERNSDWQLYLTWVADGNEASSPPAPTAAELWADHQAAAQAALDFNDRVAIRCIKAGVSYPAEWRNHDAALRAILRAESGDPSQPTPPHPATFPPGT